MTRGLYFMLRESKLWETSSVIHGYALVSPATRRTLLFPKLKCYIDEETDYLGITVFFFALL